MDKKKMNIKNMFLYCGLTREEFYSIGDVIVKRNYMVSRITTVFVTLFGVVFFLINLFTGAGVVWPYALLIAGGGLILLFRLLFGKHSSDKAKMVSCYLMMIIVFAYAIWLSITSDGIPATSCIVFFALMPLSIDDKPIRMNAVVGISSITFILCSYFFKAPDAFRLDLINNVTFYIVGTMFYLVICGRNVNELFRGGKVEKFQRDIIASMALIIEARDESTGNHIIRTENYVQAIIDRMKKTDKYSKFPESYFFNVYNAAPMHDIGKIKVSDTILNKPGKLTTAEFEDMKKHTTYGADIIRKTMYSIEEKEYFDVAYNIALFHHEKYDGTGYPFGLIGNDIPLEARIMALADVYDALISERVYKPAFSREEARKIIEEGRGTHFDPFLTDLFLDYIP